MYGNHLKGQGIASGDFCISESLSHIHFNSSTAKVRDFNESAINLNDMTTDRDLINQLIYAIKTNKFDNIAGVMAAQ